jgi:hypothetical protein
MRDTVKNNLKILGFDKEVGKVEQGLCPFCDQPVSEKDFRDEISRREYELSGMCQNCQDQTFNQD